MSKELIESDKEEIVKRYCNMLISLYEPYLDYHMAMKCAQICAIQLLIHSKESVVHMGRLGMDDKEFNTKAVTMLGKMINPLGGGEIIRTKE